MSIFYLCIHLFLVSREHPWSGDQASYDAQCVITPPDSCVKGYLSLSTACRGSALGACQCQIFSISELFCGRLTELVTERNKSAQPVFVKIKCKWWQLSEKRICPLKFIAFLLIGGVTRCWWEYSCIDPVWSLLQRWLCDENRRESAWSII